MKLFVKKISLVFIVFLGVFSGCNKDEEVERTNIYIGAMLPLTGAGASVGESAYAAIQLAVEDIQASLTARGIKANVAVFIEDTETNPDVAAQKISSFTNLGVNICIGPYSSSNVSAVKAYADNNDLLIVSPASVSTSLAIHGDNIFRLVPSDFSQGEAMAALLEDDGIELLLPIIRDDLWGNELLVAITQFFSNSSTHVGEAVKYPTTADDFTNYIDDLKTKLTEALIYHPAGEVGISLLSFGESVEILRMASQDSIFNAVKWYGSSGFANLSTLPDDNDAASFAMNQDLACPTFGYDESAADKWQPLLARLNNILGRTPEIYAFTTYDAVWLAAETILALNDSAGIESVKSTFTNIANSMDGVSGNTSLNVVGDRAYATYDFWGIQNLGNQFNWERVARYNNETGTLERY